MALRYPLFVALLAWSIAVQADEIEGAASPGDGDNLNISIRIFGIDAPELDQTCKNAAGAEYACGQVARDAIAALVKDRKVRCATQTLDRHNRPVAICHADGVDIGAALVDQGVAVAFPRYSDKYVPNEERAKTEKRDDGNRSIRDLKDMDPAVYQRLKSVVEKLLEEWEEAVHEGTLSGDEESPFIKLARERIEIEQQIADLQDAKEQRGP